MKKLLAPIAASVVTGLLSACTVADNAPVRTVGDMQASAILAPTQGNAVQGTVLFKQETNGVRLIAEVSGLTPGSHGFHVHEKGDCSAPDATSAGGHFNPHGTAHGKAGAGTHHAGDLPSLEADAQGNAMLDTVLTNIVLTGDHGIVGRGLIVHADPDDYTTQPTGNAGARVACAVIQKD
ncbi:MAG: superoxide dismutase family protein [Azoarcus sp.]|jgi:Cu-Zn family superoxide dismutase|nr:superoxide dismutase family protein [Azoarcus sp.]